MSGTLADTYLGFAKHFTDIPLKAAQTAQTWSQVPLNEAQAEQARAGAAEAQAKVPYWGAQSTKAQVEAEQMKLLMDPLRRRMNRQQDSGTDSGYTRPADEGGGDGSTAPAPPASGSGRGGGLGPGSGTNPDQPASERLAYASPPAPVTPSPAVVQLARADTGTMSDTGQLYSEGYQPVAQPVYPNRPQVTAPPQAPPASSQLAAVTPETPLGVGGNVTAGDGSVMLGQTTTQPAQGAQPGQGRQPPSDRLGSRNGEYMPEIGQIVPREVIDGYLYGMAKGANPVELQAQIRKQRNEYLLQLAYGAHDPQTWNRNVETAFDSGWLSQKDYAHIHNRPELQKEVIRGLDPEGAKREDDLHPGYVWNPQVHNYVLDPTRNAGAAREQQGGRFGPNGEWIPRYTNPTERAIESGAPVQRGPPGVGGGVEGGTGAPGSAPPPPASGSPRSEGGSGSFSTYANNLMGHENPSGDPSKRNPTSNASGLFQWMPSRDEAHPGTKATVARKYLPDVVQGMSNTQIDAHNFTQEQEYKMLQGFTADNAIALNAVGQRPSGAALFLSHYLGAGGVKELRNHKSGEVLANIPAFQAAVRANPELQGGTTVGSLIDEAKRRFGNDTVDIAGPGPGTRQPPAGGGIEGKPELPIGGAESLEVQKGFVNSETKAAVDAQAAGRQAGMQTPTILDLRNRLSKIAPGSGGEWRAGLQRYAETYMPGMAQRWTTWATGHGFDTAADRYAAMKEFLVLATQQEAQMPGVRSGLGLTELLSHASPNINMPEKAISDMLNAMLVRNQAIKDYGDGLHERVMPAASAWIEDNIRNKYTPKEPGWQQEWNKTEGTHSPMVYQAAVDSMNGHSYQDLEKRYGSLSTAQQKEVVGIIRRIDPSWHPADNQKRPVAAPVQ